jgi:hypothetical protein
MHRAIGVGGAGQGVVGLASASEAMHDEAARCRLLLLVIGTGYINGLYLLMCKLCSKLQ